MKKKKTKKNKEFRKMKKDVLAWALMKLIALNTILIWLYTKDGVSKSAREWRYKLLRAIRVLVTDKEKHAELLEWMVESHGAFDSKNEWREEFINQLCRAAGL